MKKVERENVRLIRGFYCALSGGDWSAARTLLDPDIQWIEPNIPGLWFSGIHYGSDKVFEKVIETAFDKFYDFAVKIKRFFPVGEQVVALGSFHGRAKATGFHLNARTAHVWTLHEGKVTRFQAVHDALEWQVALGLTSVQSNRMAA